MAEYAVCPVCGGLFDTEGPQGLLPHIVAFHAEEAIGSRILRELAQLPLPEPSR